MTIESHPAAASWPMLADDELDQLAADIKANGLIQPIVLDADGLILDGRNRHQACLLAGVEPTFTTFEGDPVSFVLSSNEHRRHLNKGQRAIAVVQTLYSVKSFGDQTTTAERFDISEGFISRASTVINHAPDLAESVLAGSLGLNAAYDQARQRKQSIQHDAEVLGKLRAEAPDLAELVDVGKLNLREAHQTHLRRVQELEGERRLVVQNYDTSLIGIAGTPDPLLVEQMTAKRWAKAENAHAYLTALLKLKVEVGG